MKRFVVIVALCGLAVGALATPAGASATITAGLSKTSTQVGSTVYVQGVITPASATPRVMVQRAIDHKWVDRVAGSVDPSTGAYKVAITPSQTGTYKMRVRSNGGSVWSPTIYLSVTSRATVITAGLSSTTVTVGKTAYVQGRVTPARATSRVIVQRAIDHKWVDRAAGSVDPSTGAYKVAITPSQTGTYKMRVRSNGGSVWSATIYLTVKAAPPSGPRCDPNYTGCVPIASDVDCIGGGGDGPAYVAGPITVIGTDIYHLDADHNGIACG